MSVELTINSNVAEIVLNNPEKRNVLDAAASRALVGCVEQAESQAEVNCIVLRAEGRSFCAGGSLDELMQAQSGDPAVLNEIYSGFMAVANSPLPTIALVQGAAVGAGMNLVLASDIRLVTPHAKLDTRFTQLGIHCGGGHSWMLQKFLNWEQSVAALVFGEVLVGQAIVDKGLALECVPADQLTARAAELSEGLAGVPRELIEKTKQSLALARSETSHDKIVQHEYEVQAWSLKQPYAIDRLKMFKAKISGK